MVTCLIFVAVITADAVNNTKEKLMKDKLRDLLIGMCSDMEVEAIAACELKVESEEWRNASATLIGKHGTIDAISKCLYGEEFRSSHLFKCLRLVSDIMASHIHEETGDGSAMPSIRILIDKLNSSESAQVIRDSLDRLTPSTDSPTQSQPDT